MPFAIYKLWKVGHISAGAVDQHPSARADDPVGALDIAGLMESGPLNCASSRDKHLILNRRLLRILPGNGSVPVARLIRGRLRFSNDLFYRFSNDVPPA